MVKRFKAETRIDHPRFSAESTSLQCRNQGFSLIELLIVISVIGIIASIAIPNLVQSKAAANEAAANNPPL